MSVKHVINYYNKICEQYTEMQENIKEFEEYCKTHVVSSEQLDKMKETIAPLKENYERISYIMFLLNMPNNIQKKKKYIKRTECKLPQEYKLTTMLTENDEAIKCVKKLSQDK